jgi:hypothetical protein
MYYLYIFLALIILYFLYKKYFRKELTQDLTENFDNNLIKINNKNYELDTYAVNNILNELNI